MTTFQAIVLGIVQGLTEFLPISSSGHLAIFEYFFGVQKSSLLFEVLIHLATLCAVLIYFRKTIINLRMREYFLLTIGTIPAVIFTVLFKDFIEHAFNSIWEVTIELAITGCLLIFAHYKMMKTVTKTNDENTKNNIEIKAITPLQSFIIGIWQAFAILPGISRSGTTVVGGLLLGISRETSFTFSFLLSIPAIVGATVLEFSDLQALESLTRLEIINYGIAFVFSFLFGIISLQWFHHVIKKMQFYWFGIYCLVVSFSLMGYLLLNTYR